MEKKFFVCLRFLLVILLGQFVAGFVCGLLFDELSMLCVFLGMGLSIYAALFIERIRNFVFGIKNDDNSNPSHDDEGRFF